MKWIVPNVHMARKDLIVIYSVIFLLLIISLFSLILCLLFCYVTNLYKIKNFKFYRITGIVGCDH